MGIRDAVRTSPLLTAMVVGIGAWFVVIATRTLNTMESVWSASEWVGYAAVSGLVGIAVMIGVVALLFVLFGELEESEPGPEPWVPEEER